MDDSTTETEEREARLRAIRERWSKATPGPWYGVGTQGIGGTARVFIISSYGQNWNTVAEVVCWADRPYPEHDAEAIAHAPSDVAELLTEVERLKSDADYDALKLASAAETERELREHVSQLQKACYVPPCVDEALGTQHPYQNSADACFGLCAEIQSLRAQVEELEQEAEMSDAINARMSKYMQNADRLIEAANARVTELEGHLAVRDAARNLRNNLLACLNMRGVDEKLCGLVGNAKVEVLWKAIERLEAALAADGREG